MSLLGINKKGKLVVGGLVAFALIATASTGLAAWVVGTQTGDTTSGNISVDQTVIDNQVSIEINESDSDLKVYFAPAAKKVENEAVKDYPVVNPEADSETEDLDFVIKGRVNFNTSNLDLTQMTVKMYVTSTLNSFVNTDKYIAFPEGGTFVDTTVDNYQGKDHRDGTLGYYKYELSETFAPDGETGETFSLALKFKWGQAFGGVNPCEYYDGSTGKTATEALTALEALALLNETTFHVDIMANVVTRVVNGQ